MSKTLRTRLPTIVLALWPLILSGCVETGSPERTAVAGDTTDTGVALREVGPGGAAIVVAVHVNGEGPYDFILDTGATMTCLDAALSDRLELEAPAGQVGVGMGLGQEPGSLNLVSIDSVRVGDAIATGLTGCALDLARFQETGLDVDGLLGLNFLRSFRVTLDFPAGRMTLQQD